MPEYWPDAPPTQPVRAVWLPWPMAVLLAPLFWLMPKRMGPHFAAVRWPGVIVAHLVWCFYALGCGIMAFYSSHYNWISYLSGKTNDPELAPFVIPATLGEIIRMPLAMLGINAVEKLETGEEVVLLFGAMAGIEIMLVLLLALLLMPFATAGERMRSCIGRSIKLMLWTSTSTIVLALAWQVRALFTKRNLDDFSLTCVYILWGYILWFVWIWIRSATRYAGPAEGPDWQRRQPRCERCGYLLVGLARTGACPECGSAIAESHPDTRQPAPRSFFRTYWRVLFDRSFYTKLCVFDSYTHARRFAILNACLAGPIIFGAIVLAGAIATDGRFSMEIRNTAEIIPLGSMVWIVLALLLVGLVASTRLRAGVRSPRAYAVLTFYHSAWLTPTAVVTIILGALLIRLELDRWFRSMMPDTDLGEIGAVALQGCVGLVTLGPLLLLALWRFAQGARQIRFANA